MPAASIGWLFIDLCRHFLRPLPAGICRPTERRECAHSFGKCQARRVRKAKSLFVSRKMNKSTTNRHIADQPDVGLVTRAGLGGRVLVNGHFGGILRYLGPVNGRQGIFCGVELDQPVGKNDGTHKGTFYFPCRPGHGVFAPCHKVQTAEDALGEENGIQSQGQSLGQKLLTRSAMPALASGNESPKSQQDEQQTQQPMDWSLMSMSTGSTNSGTSLFFTPKPGQEDLMAHSQATYTVYETDCPMLQDLELSDSALLLDEDEEEEGGEGTFDRWTAGILPNQSVVLDGPSLGIQLLPIIGSPVPEDTPTPMVETTNFATALQGHANGVMMMATGDKRNRNNLGLNGLGHRESQRQQQGMMANSSPNNNNGSAKGWPPVNGKMAASDARNNNNGSRTESTATPASTPMDKGAEARSGREKKPRVSVFQSVPMPSQNLSAAARAAKPKQPSKAQLVMEQLKASMEAEKHRPKKEVRSKVQQIQAVTAQVEEREFEEQQQSDIQEIAETTEDVQQIVNMKQNMNTLIRKDSTRTTTSAPLSKLAQKTDNKSQADVKKTTSSTSSSNAKPPTAVQKHSVIRPQVKQVSATGSSSTPSVFSRPLPNNHTSRQVLSSKENTSSRIGPSKSPSHSSLASRQLPKKSTSSSESVTSRTVGRLGTLFGKTASKEQDNKLLKAEQALANATNRLAERTKTADVFIILCSHLGKQALSAESEINRLKLLLEQNDVEHAAAMEKVGLGWRQQLQQANEEHGIEIDKLRGTLHSVHQKEMETSNANYQKIIAQLGEERQKLEVTLQEQAHKFRSQMEENESERNRRLTKDVGSLQYELQMKNEEVRKLRMQNRELTLLNEKMPEKEAQIVRLKAKNDDLKEDVNRLKQIERQLNMQLNEYQHQLSESIVKTNEIAMEKEVLEYQLHEKLESGMGSFPSTPQTKSGPKMKEFTPNTSVNIRTPELRRKSTERPNSSCLSQSQGRPPSLFEDDDSMTRSMDSALSHSVFNCYRQEGKSKSHNTPNKIYTPRDCYELEDPAPSSSAKRVVDFDQQQDKSHDDSAHSCLT